MDDAAGFVARVRANVGFMRQPTLHLSPSVYVAASGHVLIHTDEGRIVRPLLTWPLAERDIIAQPIDRLLELGALRYGHGGVNTPPWTSVDAAESATLDILQEPNRIQEAPDRHYDLCEVHAILMLGITAACIPLLQCNQSPRNQGVGSGGNPLHATRTRPPCPTGRPP